MPRSAQLPPAAPAPAGSLLRDQPATIESHCAHRIDNLLAPWSAIGCSDQPLRFGRAFVARRSTARRRPCVTAVVFPRPAVKALSISGYAGTCYGRLSPRRIDDVDAGPSPFENRPGHVLSPDGPRTGPGTTAVPSPPEGAGTTEAQRVHGQARHAWQRPNALGRPAGTVQPISIAPSVRYADVGVRVQACFGARGRATGKR